MTSDALDPAVGPGPGERRYLAAGLTISLAVHAGLLAVHFHAEPPMQRPRDPGLDVVLLNVRSDTAPVEASVLAQTDLEGGGEHEAGIARSPLPPAVEADSMAALQREEARRRELEAAQRDLMLALQSRYEAAQAARAADDSAVAGQSGQAEAELAVLAQQYAALSARVEDYNRRPRRHFFAPSASASRFAAYVEEWRERIESVGNAHYPAAARGRIYGSLRLTVFVRADGSVEAVSLDESSGHGMLDAAARDIVRRAAPFAPFPAALRTDTDVIAITRTWHFQNDAITMENP